MFLNFRTTLPDRALLSSVPAHALAGSGIFMRKLLLVMVMLSAAGCKIQIDMPAGGAVMSDSGLYGCAELESCTIDVDHEFFTDRFVAVPAPGYEFSHWLKQPVSFCGDRRVPDCPNRDTRAFPAFPILMSVLASDIVYSMTPVFTNVGGAAPGNSDVFTLSSVHSQTNYIVDGNSESAILEELQGAANPLLLNPATGAKPVAQASAATSHAWSWSFGGEGCALVSYSFDIDYVTTMPQLQDLDKRDAVLRDEWRDYYARVEAHEAGHQEINRAQHLRQLQALQALQEPYPGTIASSDECGEAIEARWREVMQPLWLETEQLQQQYHDRVGTSTPWSEG